MPEGKAVVVRVVATSKGDLERAIALLKAQPGLTFYGLSPTDSAGRKGDWLSYGTLELPALPQTCTNCGGLLRLSPYCYPGRPHTIAVA